MSNYRRNRIEGGSYFFTVNLCDRQSNLLVAGIDALRDAVRVTRVRHPFHIDAWVVLPDHMHCLWTLPPDDAGYPVRWQMIKALFSRSMPGMEGRRASLVRSARPVCGRDAIGNTRFATKGITRPTWIIFTSIQ